MARSRKIRRRKNRLNIIATALFICFAATIVGAAIWWAMNRKPGIDPQTLCPQSGPRGHQVLLVDKTDAFNTAQKASFDIFFKELIESTPEGYLISIFVLGDDFKNNTKPFLELCNPGTGNDKNELTDNVKELHQRYRKHFIGPMLTVSNDLINSPSAKESPILEMLQLISLHAIQLHKVKGEVNLFIVSDMLQNSRALNMYKGAFSFEKYEQSYQASKLWVDFSNVNIHLYLVNNNPKTLTDELTNFWKAYSKKVKANEPTINMISG